MWWLLLACASPCPQGSSPDPARASALLALLEAQGEGVGSPRVCFGRSGPSGVREGVVVLEGGLTDEEAAARVAHLAHHLRDDPAAFVPGDCDAQVARALRLEGEAWATEIRLRRAFGVTSPLPFDTGGEPDPQQIARWLADHPDGASGIDAIAAGYRRRCEEAR
jgi:hypothetical protein